jgi:hypothetical protein
MGIEAIELFKKVPTNMLNNTIYLCVLNACSHSALIDQALKIFQKIPFNQTTERIYTTMVSTVSNGFKLCRYRLMHVVLFFFLMKHKISLTNMINLINLTFQCTVS